MTNRGCVRFVLSMFSPIDAFMEASVYDMNILSSLDFVVWSGKPEMTSTLLKYKAELLSALARIGDSPTRFSLHNVYFYHLSRVTKSDIVNLLCKRTRKEILFYEVT